MSNQRPSRCGGAGVGYEGRCCTMCKQPVFQPRLEMLKTVCDSCEKKWYESQGRVWK